jgi:hypothetical protein
LINNPDINLNPIAKAIRVIQSCKTVKQMEVAERFANLALKEAPTPSYFTVIKYTESYYTLVDLVVNSITEQRARLA